VDLRKGKGGSGREYDSTEWMTDGVLRSTTMKVSFSLAKKPETPSSLQLKKPSAPTQKPSLFNADDDDEVSLTSDSKTKGGLGIQTLSAEASKAQKKREMAEMAVDSTVYQYDEVWDKMQVAKQKVKEAKMAETKERKVRHPPQALLRMSILKDTPSPSPSTLKDYSRPPAHGGWTASEPKRR
jgi:hypothetical protein